MQPLIHLAEITKDYGSLRALEQVSLQIDAGITGLLGPNGAGKTTLIKVLLGLVKVNAGSGEVLGFELGRQSRVIRANAGYMPEDDCYLAGLSGVEMVQFAARLSGRPAVESLRRSHEILDFCGLEQERYRAVETYSTGMRQKLKFAQAIVHDPPLLILDEPTSGLDPEERQTMLRRIEILARRSGKTVLICTHILPDVQAICDSVAILARGHVQVSERLDVLSKPASPTWQVRVWGSADALLPILEREGVAVTASGNGTLSLDGSRLPIEERIWQWAQEASVGIRSLTPARNSLEQIFLDAVRRDSDGRP